MTMLLPSEVRGSGAMMTDVRFDGWKAFIEWFMSFGRSIDRYGCDGKVEGEAESTEKLK